MDENYLEGLAKALIPYLMPYLANKIKDEMNSNQPKAANEGKYLTKNQVAEMYHISIQTLWRYEREGKLIPVRMGRKVFYRPDDVERLFE